MEHVFISGHVIGPSTVENPLLSTGHVVSKVHHKTKVPHGLLIPDVKLFIFIVVAMPHIVVVGRNIVVIRKNNLMRILTMTMFIFMHANGFNNDIVNGNGISFSTHEVTKLKYDFIEVRIGRLHFVKSNVFVE